MVLVLCEMQSVRSRIWTRVAVSKSCDDNHCTTGTPTTVMINCWRRGLTGLNSEFFFTLTSCHTTVEESCLPYLLPIARGRIFACIFFFRYYHNEKCKQTNLKLDIRKPCPFPMTITITPRTINQAIGQRSWVFANGLGHRGPISGRVITKTQKRHYKVRIKGKVEHGGVPSL